jgi:hypothetical protein
MTESRPSANAADRLEQSVGELHVPEPKADTEALLLKIGLVLPLVGLVLVLVAWYQTSGTAFVAEQIPMLISGGLLGLGLAIIGLGLFIRFSIARTMRFWSARLVVEQQAQTDRIVAALDRVEQAIADKR